MLLPKGTPVYENVPAARFAPPAVLGRLKQDALTGYARFSFPASEALLVFETGRLVSAHFEGGERRTQGFEALCDVFGGCLADGGRIDVYRLSRDLAMGVHALMHGEVLYRGQELRIVDARALMARLKAQRLNGCLRVYGEGRTALIFYKDGAPLGFFHDGSDQIETSATESQRIAGLPGARIDVLSTRSADELVLYDLLEMVNVPLLWEQARARRQSAVEKARRDAEAVAQKEREARLAALAEDLKEVAAAYLGRLGRSMLEKEISERGGPAALADPRAEAILAAVERGAKLLVSGAKVREMVEVMKTEIARRTAPAAATEAPWTAPPSTPPRPPSGSSPGS